MSVPDPEIIASGRCKVSGRTFEWSVHTSQEHRLILQPYGQRNRDEMLRITEVGTGYDIVLAMTRSPDDAKIYFSPIFVLGHAFPTATAPVPVGTRVRLRPRVSNLCTQAVNSIAVERIVSWSLSRHFRPVRCDRHGSLREPEAE